MALHYRFDELRDLIRAVKNSQKIKDVAKVQSGKASEATIPLLRRI